MEGRIIGLGLAYVDGKIHSSELHLPSERDKLPEFLDAHPEAHLYQGGSIPNILTSFVKLSGNPNIKLLSCVGNDPRGRFYSELLDQRLGKTQISTTNPTGLWVGIYGHGIREHMDFPGASTDVSVSQHELQSTSNGAFITDIDACTIPQTRDQIIQVLRILEDEAILILSLAGANKQENIDRTLALITRPPTIVFGTSSELSNINPHPNLDEAIYAAFPTSKLVVITNGEKGATIRFKDSIFSAPASYLPKEAIIDETGAGDTYMGTMLALLSKTKYTDWDEREVRNAARAASYASTLIIQSEQSGLTSDMAQLVLGFVKIFNRE